MSTAYDVRVAGNDRGQLDTQTQRPLAATAARARDLMVADLDETAVDAADEHHATIAAHTTSQERRW